MTQEENARRRVLHAASSKKSYCKRRDAILAYKKEYYKANAEHEKARSLERYAKNKERILANWAATRKWMYEIKAASGCKLCGENDPWCLDFHHKNPQRKRFTVSQAVSRSRRALEQEIKKCVVLCANCHRKLRKGASPRTPSAADGIRDGL